MIKLDPINFTVEKNAEISKSLNDRIVRDDSARQEWLRKRVDYMTSWDDYSKPIRIGEYASISNIHVPMTEWFVQAIHSYFINVFFGSQDPFVARPRSKVARERAERQNMLMKWIVNDYANYGTGIFGPMSDVFWNMCTEGWGTAKLRYEVIRRNIAILEAVDKQELNAEVSAITEMDNLKTQSAITDAASEKKFKQILKLKEVFSGPVVECIPNSDIIMPGFTRFPGDMNRLDYVAHYTRLSRETMQGFIDQGIMWQDAQELIDKEMEDKTDGKDPGKDFERVRDANSGIRTDDKSGYAFYEVYKSMDVNNDGILEDCVFYLHADSQKLMGATHLNLMLPTNASRRPLYQFGYYRRPGRTNYRGLVETIHPSQQEITMLHNLTIDSGIISNAPMGFYRPSSGMPEEPIRIESGILFPLENPREDVYFPQRPQAQVWSQQLEGMVIQYAQRASLVNDIQLGQMPSPVGAARSTSGMRELTSKFTANVFKVVKNVAGTYEIMLSDMWNLVSDRLPIGLQVRVGAISQDPAASVVTKEDVSYQMDIDVTANAMNADKATELEQAQLYINMLGSRVALETGIVSPKNLYEVYKNVLEKNGEIDVERYITDPGGALQPWTVLDELRGIVHGLKAPIVPNDDHAKKLEGIELFVKSDEFLTTKAQGKVNDNWESVYNFLMEGHSRMLEMLKAQAQMANVAGSQNPMQPMGGQNGKEGARNAVQGSGPIPAGAGGSTVAPNAAPAMGGAGGAGGAA